MQNRQTACGTSPDGQQAFSFNTGSLYVVGSRTSSLYVHISVLYHCAMPAAITYGVARVQGVATDIVTFILKLLPRLACAFNHDAHRHRRAAACLAPFLTPTDGCHDDIDVFCIYKKEEA